MDRRYKQAYEAPLALLFEVTTSLTVLDNLSVKAGTEDIEYDESGWGTLESQNWGRDTKDNPWVY